MPSTTTDAERIAALERKLEDLAGFVGRLTAGIVGDNFHAKYDCGDEGLLVWEEVLAEAGTEDEELLGWWVYKAPEEATVDA
jgi:hypothetical protein